MVHKYSCYVFAMQNAVLHYTIFRNFVYVCINYISLYILKKMCCFSFNFLNFYHHSALGYYWSTRGHLLLSVRTLACISYSEPFTQWSMHTAGNITCHMVGWWRVKCGRDCWSHYYRWVLSRHIIHSWSSSLYIIH